MFFYYEKNMCQFETNNDEHIVKKILITAGCFYLSKKIINIFRGLISAADIKEIIEPKFAVSIFSTLSISIIGNILINKVSDMKLSSEMIYIPVIVILGFVEYANKLQKQNKFR